MLRINSRTAKIISNKTITPLNHNVGIFLAATLRNSNSNRVGINRGLLDQDKPVGLIIQTFRLLSEPRSWWIGTIPAGVLDDADAEILFGTQSKLPLATL